MQLLFIKFSVKSFVKSQFRFSLACSRIHEKTINIPGYTAAQMRENRPWITKWPVAKQITVLLTICFDFIDNPSALTNGF